MPSVRDEVQHREVLGELHRVVERGQQRRDADVDARGTARHGGGDQQRRGQEAVLDAVMLGERDRVEAVFVREAGHVERGFVELGVLRSEARGRAQVEAQHRDRHGVTPPST
jgi:hypothetical protein